ncbi:MAG: hypothetical protein NVS1B1_02840 [Candidatus Limnocylindrales bacterium]
MGILVVVVLAFAVFAGLVFAIVAARAAQRPHPALPTSCGDCVFMVPRAKIYKREVLEEADGLVHYLCQQRWIEITPVSPRCSLGRSTTLVTTIPE